jgi:two-component system, NtrC family, response regulator AtoC
MPAVTSGKVRFDQTTLDVRSDRGSEDVGLALRVLGDSVFAVHPLPEQGTVVIGRSRDADVVLDDASASRRHAAIHLGPELWLEDLGSANGTRLRERVLRAGERAPLRVGEVVEIGAMMLMVQTAPLAARRTLAPPPPGPRPPPAPPSVRSLAEGVDDGMAHLERLVERVAAASISVLLLGETGVGKEVMAESIHRRSPRRDRPFLRLHCAALSEALLESELFGHEKGAFTGAAAAKPGLLETADGGTVLLDEIGELPPSVQVKLLRVLEDRRVQRVGALAGRDIDVRFVSATHRDLDAEVSAGRFRADLFFRLNGITLRIPSLRERVGEIEPLARRFAEEASRRAGASAPLALSPPALERLRGYDWPGNVRELRNVIERAVLLAGGAPISPEHLVFDGPGSGRLAPPREYAPPQAHGLPPSGPRADDDAERQRIIEALARCAGNQTHAAKLLGIARSTLVTRLDAYGLPRPRKA